MKRVLQLLTVVLFSPGVYSQQTAVGDSDFWQEYHEAYPISNDAAQNEVSSIAADNQSNIWIATVEGILMRKTGDTGWVHILSVNDRGPAYSAVASGNSVWM